jgi:uncharacterized glyoxalase superfamily protein PhnB
VFATDADAAIAFRIDVLGAEHCGRQRPPDGNVRDPELMIGDVPIMASVDVAELGRITRTPGPGQSP